MAAAMISDDSERMVVTLAPEAGGPRPWGNLELGALNAYSFGFIGFILAMDVVVLPVLVLQVAPEAAKNTLLGVIGLVGLLASAVIQIPVGWASDRTRSPVGRRLPYLLWSCVFVPLGLVGLALTLNYVSLLIFWLFIQINAGIGYSPYLASMRDLVPVNRIGAASSAKILMESLGGASTLCLTALLMQHYTGPETRIWLWGALGAFGALIISSAAVSAFTIHQRQRAGDNPRRTIYHHATIPLPETGTMSRLHPGLGWFVASRGAFLAAVVIFTTFGLFFLRDKVQVDSPVQALGVAIIGIGGALILTTYPAGWLSDRIGRKPVLFAGAGVAMASTVGMMWVDTYFQAVVVASFIGGSVGVLLSAHWALANDLGTPGREAQHIGVVNLGTLLGAAGAKVSGPLPDLVTLWFGPGYGYTALLGASALLFLIGSVLLLKVPAAHPQAASVPPATPATVKIVEGDGGC